MRENNYSKYPASLITAITCSVDPACMQLERKAVTLWGWPAGSDGHLVRSVDLATE